MAILLLLLLLIYFIVHQLTISFEFCLAENEMCG